MIHWLIVFINICCFAYTGECFLDFVRGMLFWVIGFFEFAIEFGICAGIAEHYYKIKHHQTQKKEQQ